MYSRIIKYMHLQAPQEVNMKQAATNNEVCLHVRIFKFQMCAAAGS